MGAEISTRHLSFVETGRSVPSREMVLRLSERPAGGRWLRAHVPRTRPGRPGADPALVALLEELRAYPVPEGADLQLEGEHLGIAMPFQLRTPGGVLSFISTITIFGTPVDVTLQELALETFFPADELTRQALQSLATSA